MDPILIRYSELPGATRLFIDYLYAFERLAPFYSHPPGGLETFLKVAAGLEFPTGKRSQLVEALAQDNPGAQALDRLAQPGTVAVVTGQQVGLFGGPAYTIYKALTAAKLAQTLTEAGIPAVPIFWCATEDHDFEEVRHAWLFDASCRPVRASVDYPASGEPAGSIIPGPFPISTLRAAFAESPFGHEITDQVEEHYREGRSMGEAFRGWMSSLLSRFGILFLDPLRPALRSLAAPVLARAAAISGELTAAILERSRELEAAGYHVQVQVAPGGSLFFALHGGKRVPLKQESEQSNPALFAPEQLSPNALLRPVMQDSMLPVVAHIAGPAEIAYLAQSQVLYRALGVPQPVEVPRAGFTLLGSRTLKLMRRFGLTLANVLAGEETLLETISRQMVPPELEAAFQTAEEQVRSALSGLRPTVDGFDHTLAAALDKSSAKMLYQLAKIRRKAHREAMRRDESAAESASYLSHLLAPHRRLQERFYSILPFLAWHGPDLLEHIYQHINLESHDHILLPVP